MILRAIRVAASIIREKTKCRSPRWPKIRRAWLYAHPTCAACGGTFLLQAHHVEPYHLNPARELDPKNLITLCMGSKYECHVKIGHGDSFKAFNPNVRADSATVLRDPTQRQRVEAAAASRRRLSLSSK